MHVRERYSCGCSVRHRQYLGEKLKLTQYVITGRCCDYDDHAKVVNAESEADAKKKFEQYVRKIEDVEDGDFYVEHIKPLTEMISSSI